MLGDFTNFDEYVDEDSYMPLWIGMILFTIFLSIIMLNLLISIIGDTYGKVVAAEKSNRTYEILNVIYEIEKFKILGSKKYDRLKESQIIGDYLICFHNINHFMRDDICLENEELKEKIIQSSMELKSQINENFQIQSKNIEKIQEKNELLNRNYSKIQNSINEKMGKFEEKMGKFEEKIEGKIDSMMDNYLKIQNLLMEMKNLIQPK